MLMATKAALPTHPAMVLVLIVDVMRLMAMTLTLEAFVHVHLIALVTCTAVEEAMVLPMAAMIVHAEGIVRRRVRARRSVRRRRIGVLLE